MEGLQRPDNNGLILNFACSRRNGRGHLLTIETRHPLRMRRLWPGVAWLRQAAACASGRAVRIGEPQRREQYADRDLL